MGKYIKPPIFWWFFLCCSGKVLYRRNCVCMAMIRLFYDEFNNREKALLTLVGIIFLSLIVYKNIRPHILKLFGIFLTGKLGLAIYIGICCVLIMIYGLILVGFWEPSLLKDSIFWFAGVAF